MTHLPANYDTWRLATPYDDFDGIGTEDGEPCNRILEPDEDAPRNYRPRPCEGSMVEDQHGDVVCESCGEAA